MNSVLKDLAPLSLYDFKAWLESKNRSEIVGERRDSCKCPLANWIKETNNLSSREVSVNRYNVFYISTDYTIPTTNWMKSLFITLMFLVTLFVMLKKLYSL